MNVSRGTMRLVKGARPGPICRECRALHGAKDCPRRARRRYRVGDPWTRRRYEEIAALVQELKRAV